MLPLYSGSWRQRFSPGPVAPESAIPRVGRGKKIGRGCVLPRKTPSTPKTERGDALLPAPDAGLQFGRAAASLVRAEPLGEEQDNLVAPGTDTEPPQHEVFGIVGYRLRAANLNEVVEEFRLIIRVVVAAAFSGGGSWRTVWQPT